MMTVLIGLEFIAGRRARTHQTHIAQQHVPELRKLIEMSPAHNISARDDARIIANLEERAVHLIAGHQFGKFLFGVEAHRAKFVKSEEPSIAPHPLLAKEYGAGRDDPQP